ncbi:MAG: DegT/DnrJ/EryC1/StrS family aminotransferase [Oscillospiraceae bacterium]
MELSGLRAQYEALSPQIAAAMNRVLSEGKYIGGKQIERLERALAHHTQSTFALCCASGTDALTLALLAWGARAGDAVFLPSFTFAATAEAVALRGATPVFVDIDPSYCLDPCALTEAIDRVRREGWLRPAGIVAVDLFGLPADYQQIGRIAAAEGLWLLEDAAQSFGASRFGQMACSFGEIAATSFFPSKPLGCYGDGGAVFTNELHHAETIASLRCHGCGIDKYDNRLVGINSRLDTLQAAVLLEKLDVFPHELTRRRALAAFYTERLSGAVITPPIPPEAQPSWAQYTIRLPSPMLRDRLRLELSANGIPSAVYYPKPLHLQGAFSYLGIKRGALPESEAAARQVLSLPMHPYLTDGEAELVCETILRFIERTA